MNHKLFYLTTYIGFFLVSATGITLLATPKLPAIQHASTVIKHDPELALCLQIASDKKIKHCLQNRALKITPRTATCIVRRLETLDAYLEKNPQPQTKELKKDRAKYIHLRRRTLETARLLIEHGMNTEKFKGYTELQSIAARRASAPSLPAIKMPAKKP